MKEKKITFKLIRIFRVRTWGEGEKEKIYEKKKKKEERNIS